MGLFLAQVLEGSEVAVMEAMKMQNKLRAPKSGKIKKVHAKVIIYNHLFIYLFVYFIAKAIVNNHILFYV